MTACATPTSDRVYLVDTDVLSAGAPTKVAVQQGLVEWMDRNSSHLFLSVITVAEIEDGIAKSRRTGATTKATHIAEWLETVLYLHSARILPIDLAAARLIGALADHARAAGQAPGFADLAVAATAKLWGYTVLTRNLRHFGPIGVAALDPFRALPPDAGTISAG